MPFLNSSQQIPLKTQKVSLYIDWGFGLRQLLKSISPYLGEGRYRDSTERCVVSGGKRRRIGVLMGSWRVMFGIAGRRRRARACVSGRGGVTVRAAAAALFFGLFVVFLGLGPCFCPRQNFCDAFFCWEDRGSVVSLFKPLPGFGRASFCQAGSRQQPFGILEN